MSPRGRRAQSVTDVRPFDRGRATVGDAKAFDVSRQLCSRRRLPMDRDAKSRRGSVKLFRQPCLRCALAGCRMYELIGAENLKRAS